MTDTSNYTPLCHLAEKHFTDKGPKFHGYTKHYYNVITNYMKPEEVKVVGEIGIGHVGCMQHLSGKYRPGASLRMWREFFPNAHIYGFDIKHELFFMEDRISCIYMDQGDVKSMAYAFASVGKPYDIIVDDGSHDLMHQLNTKEYAGDHLREGGLLIIEDINDQRNFDNRFNRPPPGFELVAKAVNTPGDNYAIYRKLGGGSVTSA